MTVQDHAIKEVLYTEEQLAAKIKELGAAITRDYAGKDLLMVSILKGSVMVMADLMRAVDLPLGIDFMNVSSYGAGTVTQGHANIIKDLDVDIEGKDVLIVEDILDSGVTLSHVMEILRSRKPASLRLCSLLEKPERHKVYVPIDYLGFVVPDEFVVGYGLDYAEKYRNLPYVGVLKESVYSK
jgi:hypoxanthine phosphoribosyltransferase